MAERKQRRGAYRREDCTFVGAWVPSHLVELVDEAVKLEDTDRSKLLRRALEEKIQKVTASPVPEAPPVNTAQ